MKHAEKLINKIKAVLDSDLTAYRIAKEVGYAGANPVHDLRSGKSDIMGIKLNTAIKFEELYNKTEEDLKMNNTDVKGFFEVNNEFIEGKKEYGSVKTKVVHREVPASNTHNAYAEYRTIEVALTQQPYIVEGFKRETYDLPLDEEKPFYIASGIDADGNEYEIAWEVVENFEDIEDEQEMVEDWDKPASVIVI